MHAISRSSLPPGPSTPSLLQALRFARDPFGYLATCAANYGDLFTLRLPGQPATIVTSAPELVRQCFALRPTSPRRPLPLSANVGEQSLIFLDGEPHQRSRERRVARRLLPWQRWADAKATVLNLLRADITRCRAGAAGPRSDVLAMLAAARYPDGAMMGEAQLIDELVTLLVGGHETTANTVSFALYRVLQRPDVVAEIRAELTRVFGQGPIDPLRTGELRYLDACIKESMRLTPILPAISRPVPTPVTLRGHTIPAGCDLWLAPSLTHMRPDLWDRPEQFMPERFLAGPAPTSHYFPFGGGHRTCIGRAFATVEMRIILAELLRRVDVHLSPRTSVRVGVRGSTVAPLGPLELVVERVRPIAC